MSRYPALRLVLPVALGILAHRLWHSWIAPLVIILLAIAGYIWLEAKSHTPQGRLQWRPYFILPIAFCALALGWLSAVIHCPPHLTDDQRKHEVLAGRVANIDYTDFSMQLEVDVLDKELPPCRVLVSTRGCDYTMQAGDIIAWPAALDEVGNMGNPDEMDYAAYLLDNKGIRYQQHLPVERIKRTGYSPTLMTRLTNARRHLQLQILNSRVSPAVQQFVTAILLGNSGLIDKATRQEFAAAGVAHILALSGLHVGIIALIIWGLLFPLDYMRLKKLRLVITLAAIILFAVFTGLAPSVVRATIMIGMVFASLIFYRRAVAVNALALAALLILVCSPSSLYSVGFQLSFITVGAVLLFARLPKALSSRFKLVNYFTSTAITSLVAMLATVALTAHYFHTVSLMSVLVNLLILPALPVFMILAAVFLLVTAAGMHWPLLDWMLETIYRYIHWSTATVNAIPGSHFGGIYVSTFGVVAYFIVLALVILWLYRRHYRYLLLAGCTLAVLLGHSLWVEASTPRQGLIIFNSFSSTPVLYYEGDMGYVWSLDDEEPDSTAFSRYYAGFLARHSINGLQFITDGDSLMLDNAMIQPPYAHLMGRRILAVGGGNWKRAVTNHRLKVDDILVTKRYHGSAAKLQELYQFERLVLSGALYDKSPLFNECDSLDIPVHDLSAQGALTIATH